MQKSRTTAQRQEREMLSNIMVIEYCLIQVKYATRDTDVVVCIDPCKYESQHFKPLLTRKTSI